MNFDVYENDAYRQLYEQYKQLKIAATFDSLTNTVNDEVSQDLFRQLDICGIHIGGGAYLTILLQPDNQEYYPVDGTLESQRTEFRDRIQWLIEHYFLGKSVVYVTQFSGMVVAFQYYSSDYPFDEQEAVALARKEWRRFQQLIADQYGLSCSIAMSSLYRGTHGLYQSYYQSRDLMAYAQFTGQKFCCIERPVEPVLDFIEDTIRLYDIVRQTVFLLFHEPYTRQVALDVVNALLTGINASLRLVQYRCNIYFALLLVDLQRNGLDVRRAALEPFFNKLLEFRTQEELTDCIDQLMSQFFKQYGLQGAHSQGVFRLMEVINYIHEHLHESTLSVTEIADRFQMSQPNLSYHFKKETGQSLSRYIAQKRLEYALKLLIDSDDILDQVAGHAGYGSTISLQRAVKQAFNLTPKEYREKNKK